MSRHRAFELYDGLYSRSGPESRICIRDIAHFHPLAADCGSGGRWFESTQRTSKINNLVVTAMSCWMRSWLLTALFAGLSLGNSECIAGHNLPAIRA